MSFNVSGTKYVAVYDSAIKPNFSEFALCARLRTSTKTNKPKVNGETGEILTSDSGNVVYERKYHYWNGIFVANAFEPSKALRNGDMIDITVGWIEQKEDEKSGVIYYNVYISDYEISTTKNTITDNGDAESVDVFPDINDNAV